MTKKIIKRNVIGLLLLLAPFCVFAQETAAQQLGQWLTILQSMTANFQQKLLGNSNDVIQESDGTMAFVRPGKFRWDVKSPNPQLIVINGKDLWIYDASLEQATHEILKPDNATSPAFLLSGSYNDLASRFYVSKIVQVGSRGSDTFDLRPKGKDKTFQWIQLYFNNAGLQSMRFADNLGQVSLITFTNVQANPNLPESLFTFHPPAGTDVIDNTKTNAESGSASSADNNAATSNDSSDAN